MIRVASSGLGLIRIAHAVEIETTGVRGIDYNLH
jgi:hypothetical protein